MPMTTQIQAGSFSTAQSQTGAPSSILGKDDFLKLLTMQLRYQDPMDPMKGTEFAAQLAQFSSVEQLSNISTNIQQSIDANYLMTQSINNALATTFVGKDVRATGNKFQYNELDVKLGYTLPSTATSVTVKIFDESGTLVRTMTNMGGTEGDNAFTWDGTNDQGAKVGIGKYKFSVEAKDASGAAVNASLYIAGKVSAIRFKVDGTVFVIDGMEVKLSDILEIMQG